MKLLELFSGTGSVGKVAIDLGFDVTSLDRDMTADIQTDIMNWNYEEIEPKTFDVIWASPPCVEYSRAKTTAPRDIEGANMIVARTLEIIAHLQPKYFIVENPQTGLLKDQWFMNGIPYNDVDYCKYGMPYRKRTRLWNNIELWTPKPLCKRDCNSMNEERTRHIAIAQRGPIKSAGRENRKTQSELYMVPSELVHDLFSAILSST
jgi:site-specific DNA-cytosine methylase